MNDNHEKFKQTLQKYKEKEADKEKNDLDDGEPEVKYAFITFRHMDAVDYVKKAYKVGWLKRKLTACFGCCCKDYSKALRKKHFFDKWLVVEDSC